MNGKESSSLVNENASAFGSGLVNQILRPERARAFTLALASATLSLACAQTGGSAAIEDAGATPTPGIPVGRPAQPGPVPPPTPSPNGDAGYPSVPWDSGVQSTCPGTPLIYVVSDSNEMYTFDPSTQSVDDLGSFSCPGEPAPNPATGSGAANSLAVDANGTAWVNFQDGRIYRVSTASLSCKNTSFQAGQAGFSPDLGMAFVSDGVGSGSETLYVSDNPGAGGMGHGLGWIDTATMILSPIGAYTNITIGSDAELTGTPAGLLYGFFATSPATLAQVDVQTGATSGAVSLPGVNVTAGSSSCDPTAWVYMGNDPNACDGLLGESCGWTWSNQGQGYHCATTSWGTGCEPGGAACPPTGGYAAGCDPNAWVYMGDNPNACDGLLGESCGWTTCNEGQGYLCTATSWGTGCQPGGAVCAATGAGNGYAMAYSGGRFWLFTASSAVGGAGPTTAIAEYDPIANQISNITANIDDSIVGAAVPTCLQ